MMTDAAPMREDWERQGTWERAAWQVAVLAGELGLELDAEALILSDVRDLLTLRGQLRRQLTRGAWPVRRSRVKGDGLRITTMGRPGRRVTGGPPG